MVFSVKSSQLGVTTLLFLEQQNNKEVAMKLILKLSMISALTVMIALPASAKSTPQPIKAKAVVKVAVKKADTKKAVVQKVSVKKAQVSKPVAKPRVVVKRAQPTYRVTRTSYGRQYGLDQTYDPLALGASVALVVDQNSWTTEYDKNSRTQLPIASITKLMTAMVTMDAGLDMNETITISDEEANHYRSSRLSVGTTLSRRDVMLLSLMSSENRAAYALGRTYPGGMGAFVQAMNAKAAMLNMSGAYFVDPSGLSSANQASAMDLAKMVNAASQYKTIRQLSTTETATVYTPMGKELVYHNSNRLISRNMGWNIGMQKTGTLSAAGKCVVIQAVINGSPKIIVLLDSRSSDSRVKDAVRIKEWLESGGAGTISSLKSQPDNI